MRAALDTALAELREGVPAEAFAKVAGQFAADVAEWTENLADRLAKAEGVEAGRCAHRLAGLFGQLGLAELTVRCRAFSHAPCAPSAEGEAIVAAGREVLPVVLAVARDADPA